MRRREAAPLPLLEADPAQEEAPSWTQPHSIVVSTDSLLIEASDGLEQVAAQLEQLYRSWTQQHAGEAALDWLATVVTDVHWWSGRLLGGVSFVDLRQEVPDTDGE